MIEVRPAVPKAPEFLGYKKGTLIRGKDTENGKFNIYIVLEDSPVTQDIYCLRLVSLKPNSAQELEVCRYVSHSLVTRFDGELVIKNG